MAKSAKNRRKFLSRKFRSTPYPTSLPCYWDAKESCNSTRALVSERKDWEEATCSVCMEFPHNAVLLLCSSHDNGCRPYMCGTSHRHSNCLEQFKKKARAKISCTEGDSLGDNPISLRLTSSRGPLINDSKLMELSCPLCRGKVKGWTVVESARRYLNGKRRSCMQDDCSFMGTYEELRKHAKSEHRCAKKPREVDPEMEEKWRELELESERQDVMSTIMSSVPRSVVFGDYVIEMAADGEDGVAGGTVDDGTPLLLNRNILYVLREGARLMRLQWDDAMQESGGVDVAVNGVNGVADIDDAVSANREGGGADFFGPERGNRRRRQRSRRPAPFDVR